jgi:hypothetical protein
MCHSDRRPKAGGRLYGPGKPGRSQTTPVMLAPSGLILCFLASVPDPLSGPLVNALGFVDAAQQRLPNGVTLVLSRFP